MYNYSPFNIDRIASKQASCTITLKENIFSPERIEGEGVKGGDEGGMDTGVFQSVREG